MDLCILLVLLIVRLSGMFILVSSVVVVMLELVLRVIIVWVSLCVWLMFCMKVLELNLMLSMSVLVFLVIFFDMMLEVISGIVFMVFVMLCSVQSFLFVGVSLELVVQMIVLMLFCICVNIFLLLSVVCQLGIDLSLLSVLFVWLRLCLFSCGMVMLKDVISGVSGSVILLLILLVECLLMVFLLRFVKFMCFFEVIIVLVSIWILLCFMFCWKIVMVNEVICVLEMQLCVQVLIIYCSVGFGIVLLFCLVWIMLIVLNCFMVIVFFFLVFGFVEGCVV